MTDGNGSSGSDPIGDFQRWLMRAGAKSLGREVKDQFRRATGGSSQNAADVWETATTEPPVSEEPPECAWCPICRAARKARQSGPGLASQVAGAGDALFGIAQDALSAFESTLSGRHPAPPAAKPSAPPEAPRAVAGNREGTGWPGEDVGRLAQRAEPGGPDHRS